MKTIQEMQLIETPFYQTLNKKQNEEKKNSAFRLEMLQSSRQHQSARQNIGQASQWQWPAEHLRLDVSKEYQLIDASLCC